MLHHDSGLGGRAAPPPEDVEHLQTLATMVEAGEDVITRLRSTADTLEVDVRRLRRSLRAACLRRAGVSPEASSGRQAPA